MAWSRRDVAKFRSETHSPPIRTSQRRVHQDNATPSLNGAIWKGSENENWTVDEYLQAQITMTAAACGISERQLLRSAVIALVRTVEKNPEKYITYGRKH